MNPMTPDRKRRRLLAATALLAGSGGVAALYPVVANWKPDALPDVAATLEVDLSSMSPGAILTVEWSGKPVWIVWRTPEMLRRLEAISAILTGAIAQSEPLPVVRNSIHRPEIAVLIGVCTHLGCVPLPKLMAGSVEGMAPDWPGGFVCPCHGATFDLAGRVFKNTLASTNLSVPPHFYLSENRILIGASQASAA